MTAPSWYGEQLVTYEEKALNLIAELKYASQDEALTELSGGFDSYRDGARNALRKLIDAGAVVMVWSEYGMPFYVHPEYLTYRAAQGGLWASETNLIVRNGAL